MSSWQVSCQRYRQKQRTNCRFPHTVVYMVMKKRTESQSLERKTNIKIIKLLHQRRTPSSRFCGECTEHHQNWLLTTIRQDHNRLLFFICEPCTTDWINTGTNVSMLHSHPLDPAVKQINIISTSSRTAEVTSSGERRSDRLYINLFRDKYTIILCLNLYNHTKGNDNRPIRLAIVLCKPYFKCISENSFVLWENILRCGKIIAL